MVNYHKVELQQGGKSNIVASKAATLAWLTKSMEKV